MTFHDWMFVAGLAFIAALVIFINQRHQWADQRQRDMKRSIEKQLGDVTWSRGRE